MTKLRDDPTYGGSLWGRVPLGVNGGTCWARYSSIEALKRVTTIPHPNQPASPTLRIPHSYIEGDRVFRVGFTGCLLQGTGRNYLWEVNDFTYQQFYVAFRSKGIMLMETRIPLQQDEALYSYFNADGDFDIRNKPCSSCFLFKPAPGAQEMPIYF
jgi:hypothetical protein